jgi:heme-binding NEAT domain protein
MGCLIQITFDSSVDCQTKKNSFMKRHADFLAGPRGVNIVSEEEENDREVVRFYVMHGVEPASLYISEKLKKDKMVYRASIIS